MHVIPKRLPPTDIQAKLRDALASGTRYTLSNPPRPVAWFCMFYWWHFESGRCLGFVDGIPVPGTNFSDIFVGDVMPLLEWDDLFAAAGRARWFRPLLPSTLDLQVV